MEGPTVRWLVLRLELAIGTLAPVVIAWLWLAVPPPHFGSPVRALPPLGVMFVAGMARALVGVAWMWRIWWADPEAGGPPWRYRDDRLGGRLLAFRPDSRRPRHHPPHHVTLRHLPRGLRPER